MIESLHQRNCMYSTPSPRLTFGHLGHFYLAVIDCLDGKMDQIIQVRVVSDGKCV